MVCLRRQIPTALISKTFYMCFIMDIVFSKTVDQHFLISEALYKLSICCTDFFVSFLQKKLVLIQRSRITNTYTRQNRYIILLIIVVQLITRSSSNRRSPMWCKNHSITRKMPVVFSGYFCLDLVFVMFVSDCVKAIQIAPWHLWLSRTCNNTLRASDAEV